ncbi:MAG: cation-transporting P-type ATPase, partial [Anaerolineales bacterium]
MARNNDLKAKKNSSSPESKPGTSVEKLSLDELQHQLNTTLEGLSQEDAERRLEQYGRNTIEEKKVNPILQFFSYFWGPIPWMIEVAAVLSAILGHWV